MASQDNVTKLQLTHKVLNLLSNNCRSSEFRRHQETGAGFIPAPEYDLNQ